MLCYNDSNETVMCGFARITDSVKKTDEELISLRQAGYNGLTIGVETGDDAALSFMQKAILHRIFWLNAKDLIRQKLNMAFSIWLVFPEREKERQVQKHPQIFSINCILS